MKIVHKWDAYLLTSHNEPYLSMRYFNTHSEVKLSVHFFPFMLELHERKGIQKSTIITFNTQQKIKFWTANIIEFSTIEEFAHEYICPKPYLFRFSVNIANPMLF